MKKILVLTILSIFLASCGNSEEETTQNNENNPEQNQETQTGNTQDEQTQTGATDGEELDVEDIYEVTEEQESNSGTLEQEEQAGTGETDITEEEILEDIDALINEIINTTENEGSTK